MYHCRRDQHPDFEMIQKRNDEPYLAEGQVKVTSQATSHTISNVDIFEATIIFHTHRTFTLGPGVCIMGWCDPENPTKHNLLIDCKHGTYWKDGYYLKGSRLHKNLERMPSMKEGDTVTFGTFGNSPMINDIVLDDIEINMETWKVLCLINNGTISI